MAPSAAKLKEALIQGTRDVFEAEPDETSVNKVRRHVEKNLGLEEGFFTKGKWKHTSKAVIKEQVDYLLDAAEAVSEAEAEADAKPRVKRQSPKSGSPQAKRRKGAPSEARKKQEENGDGGEDQEVEAAEDEPEEDEPRTKEKAAKSRAPRRKTQVAAPDAEASEEDGKPKGRQVASRRAKPKPKTIANPDEDIEGESGAGGDSQDVIEADKIEQQSSQDSTNEMDQESDEEKPKAGRASEKTANGAQKGPARPQSHSGEEEAGDAEAQVNEEDEYSDVIQDPLPKSRKKAAPKEASSKRKAAASAAPKKAKASALDDPHEAEIKKLQSQLAKCGIRKLWHNELKQYGNDARAKIRHLKTMLTDVGMDGRFSEAKAREIREMRELRADVEAAQEMNKLWGLTSGRRASRSKSKSQSAQMDLDLGGDDEDEDADKEGGEVQGRDGGNEEAGGEDEDEDEETSFAARRRRAHADLAFLGDDSDSE